MGEPQPKVESLVSEVLRYNQGYFGKFPPNLNTVSKIWIDKRIIQNQDGVIIYIWPQFF